MSRSLSGIIASGLTQLNAPLSSSSYANPDDVIGVKTRLKDDGYYEEPSYGITPYPDTSLFDGIKKFQRDNDLTIDGIMNPYGETENAMRFPVQLLASNHPIPDVIAPKKEFFGKDLREGRKIFADALNKVDVSKREMNALMKTYDFEGGDRADGNTVSGIVPQTMQMINQKYNLKLPSNSKPKDLTPLDKAKVITNYGDYSFERIGGRKAWDKFPDDHSAETLYDTMVRHGPEGGSLMVRKALNNVTLDNETPLDLGPGRIGNPTFDRLKVVLGDKNRAKSFYESLANERLKAYPNEGTRFNYFKLND